ncbi:ATP synthase subunit d, mitochondrial-like [Adelges cooleyi]|uniref:ATP synthase subunit d, mitochondrial-like n=1 Tax=Adelges cooleyi TaxID=133065 RepID=UPI00217FA357|nr:ATP synthase subunit d, mitochondrial-like [Adelges cooleyi]
MAKRIVQSSVNWAAIAERAPETEKAAFLAFKAKSDGYLRKMLSAPAEPPKIDFAKYKSTIAVAGLVDNFEKQYSAVKIPYPEDKYTAAIINDEKKTVQEIEKFKVQSAQSIKEAELRIEEIGKLLPYSQMTYEDAAYIEPDLTIDIDNKPSFWPHTEEDYIFDEPEAADNQQIGEQKKVDAGH